METSNRQPSPPNIAVDSDTVPIAVLPQSTTEQELGKTGLTTSAAPQTAEADAIRDEQAVTAATLMIVDDEPINIKVVRKYLERVGYNNYLTTTDSRRAVDMMHQSKPDLVLLDIMMPYVSGLEILEAMQGDETLRHIPVVILTASNDADIKFRALQLGATDFLAKPVDPNELTPRVRNALIVKAHQDHLQNYAEQLEEQVRRRTAELAASRREVIFCLARASEYRDNETGQHILRVGRYAGILARELGFSKYQAEALELAAQLHDVGKIGIPDAILRKPGKLDADEFLTIQKHCSYGRQIIEPLSEQEVNVIRSHAEMGARLMDAPKSPVLKMASRIALTHHEKWDGTGYPLGLAGEDIPIEGRITSVADVFDALSSQRSYKAAFPLEKCFAIMEQRRGLQFDPKVLDAFFTRRDEIVEIQIQFADVE